jgi:hypothetical protein
MNQHDPEFERIMHNEFTAPNSAEYTDPTPYGGTHTVKTGLTKRGKAALAFGATVIAGGTLVGYQAYAAQAAEANAKAQEIALKQQQFEFQKQMELNRVTAASQKSQNATNSDRQKQIDACVASNKNLIGKSFNSSYQDIVEACQAQYTTATSSDDMQTAGSADQATSAGTAGGLNGGLLIGGGVLGVGAIAVAKRWTRSNQA